MNQLHEQDCIEAVLKGDSRAYAPLVTQYQSMVYGIGLNVLKDAAQAEDLAQEVFIKAYKSLGSFEGKSKFSTWLYRIAYYAALDAKKKRDRRGVQAWEEVHEKKMGESPALEGHWEEDPKKRMIKTAMGLLPADQKTIIELFYFEELSLKEIAQALGMSDNNVKVKLHRARKRLYTALEGQKQTLIAE
ncbi:RNA polymerase sigma factor [Sediminicola luteus]|uniref:RNA polymerase sigma factor n=1 Tax=Sediminicola luteus TaxID=319238 RepID=A0A2A4GDF4_9FLAO|nr:sigma-70 family RNA polymerase sigma factor [Sediminicola luteus]PCE66451.1 hypothetical protein B7P33_03920 [Sediminicola luteus]